MTPKCDIFLLHSMFLVNLRSPYINFSGADPEIWKGVSEIEKNDDVVTSSIILICIFNLNLDLFEGCSEYQ